ncbi:hypothetical protein [Sphingomonas rubra]|uniref:Tetratricopeptide repeat-containing protein n=1 Tax=Sphingomonas rubra TaxID=634430 RepID=A0A1I5PJX7_9SPHN|nr:hypothetical protein [Sphingomonas rubra]SFP33851.1 hypothetical protein SAMN04488241_10134 [Sphingomonas rubra]
MKTISKLALALALTTGVTGLALPSPAVAQKKKDDKKPGLKLSPAVIKAAQPAQAALAAKDLATAEPNVAAIEAAATTEDDKYIAAALRLELEQRKLIAQQEANPNAPISQAPLAGPLDALIALPNTPQADKGRYVYRRALLAYEGKQWPVAIQYLNQAKQLGYTDPDLTLRLANAKINGGDIAGGLTDLDAAIAESTEAGKPAPEDYYRIGVARANQAKLGPQTIAWMQKYVTAYPTQKNWRDVIVTYGLAGNSTIRPDDAQKIDLFRLMRQTKSLADQNDYIEYALLAQKRGLPQEAASVLREGTANGRIPAGNTEAKATAAEAAASIKAEGSLDPLAKRANAAADGKLAASTADAYMGADQFPQAIALYRTALQKGGVNADEVNTRLGIALTRSGDKAGAKAAFEAVKTPPRAGIAALWTTAVDAPAA